MVVGGENLSSGVDDEVLQGGPGSDKTSQLKKDGESMIMVVWMVGLVFVWVLLVLAFFGWIWTGGWKVEGKWWLRNEMR